MTEYLPDYWTPTFDATERRWLVLVPICSSDDSTEIDCDELEWFDTEAEALEFVATTQAEIVAQIDAS